MDHEHGGGIADDVLQFGHGEARVQGQEDRAQPSAGELHLQRIGRVQRQHAHAVTARDLEPRWIPGALHVPLEDVARKLKELPRDRDVILYCTCPSEASAARVAKILMNQGFKRVRPLLGGLDAWVAAGYAVITAEAPDS